MLTIITLERSLRHLSALSRIYHLAKHSSLPIQFAQ
jgi:hypothetical protein